MPENKTIKSVIVAIAVIFDANGESVLVGQRTDKQPLGGYWEFPGGKCDAGETPEDCLIREVREETGIEVDILKPWPPIDFTYTHAAVRIFPFICRHKSGHPQPLSSQKLLWIPVERLSEYSFPPANEGLLQEVLRGFQHLMQSPVLIR